MTCGNCRALIRIKRRALRNLSIMEGPLPCAHQDSHYQDCTWNEIPYHWQQVMKQCMTKNKSLLIQMMVQGENPRFEEAILGYCQEKVELREQVDRVHQECVPDESPWS
jgi:hypothetical protein